MNGHELSNNSQLTTWEQATYSFESNFRALTTRMVLRLQKRAALLASTR